MIEDPTRIDAIRARLGDIPDCRLETEDPARLELVSQDIWTRGETAAAIATPGTLDALVQLMKASAALELPVFVRGGGVSYTGGYVPSRPGALMVDLSGLGGVHEINRQDMYVTVGAGCTWAELDAALKPLGLRTPFWGTLSGLKATIGGSLSQHSTFLGAGQYGASADSVIALTVVTPEGRVIRTGSDGTEQSSAFWRHYGPDLTGVFLGDAGSLAIKAAATLRLIPRPEHEAWASFTFTDRDAMIAAMSEVSRSGLASEMFGFDPNLQRVRMKRASLASDAQTLAKVVGGQKSLVKGLVEGAKIAMAGRDFLDEAGYSCHFATEGRSEAGVAEAAGILRDILVKGGGEETENSIPKIIRAAPFGPLNTMLGPEGERWAPVHGIVPHSSAREAWDALDTLFESHADACETYGITTGYLALTQSTNSFLIEPVFIWPEAIWPIHEQGVEASHLARLKRFEANPEATAMVTRLRQGVVDVFTRLGGTHYQIGKTYPYAATRRPETLDLLRAVKAHTDPDGRLNPGGLGLGEVSR